ncbi:hypothetical protein [Aliiruegeria sabulilitoris]|uniref:hypothetical protein n=1 Tax=Aliiruegeria sabulilitoris TaxID=1510458 RepID=UPI00082DE57F|nr:hypothetical protein [Aliiruegeria sabulilitoris]NDR55649.1 hypothetical protein [Pseudoruegeria sp. M32A2M]
MPRKLIMTATFLSMIATLSNAQNDNSNGLSGLVFPPSTAPITGGDTLNSDGGTTAFNDLVRSAGIDVSSLGEKLGQDGDPLSNGAGFAQVLCSLHKRLETRAVAPSFAGSPAARSGSFDPLALN